MGNVVRSEAFHLIRRVMQEHTATWNYRLPEMTKPQYAVLRAISESPGLEQSALLEPAVATKATLTELLKRLENRGWVARTRDELDRRRWYVFLTKDGQAALSDAQHMAAATDEVFLSKLDKEEQKLLMKALKKMLD